MNTTFLIVDGNAIMHRAFHAIPPFKTKAGIPTNIIYGFFGMVSRAIDVFTPGNLVIAFDTPKPTFREELLPSYQAHRPSISDDFKVQIPLLKELLDVSGMCRMELDGYEADDIIGTLSLQATKRGYQTYIFTGDRDIMQLVDAKTAIVSPQIGMSKIIMYDEAAVKEKMGVDPQFISDFKALAGDPSDNYRGADGIGVKTAIQLVSEFGHVENLLNHIDDIEKPAVARRIKENREEIITSKRIATIVRDVPGIEFDEIHTAWSTFPDALREKLETYEMRTLVQRLYTKKPTPAVTTAYEPTVRATPPDSDQLGLF